MHNLKVLFLGKNDGKAIGAAGNQYEFKHAVGKLCKCKFIGSGYPKYIADETTEETVQRIMPDADWVIDDNIDHYIKYGKPRDYKVGTFISDLHAKHNHSINNPVEWAYLLNKAGYDGIFMRYPLVYGTGYRPEIFYEILGTKAHWIPWSVDTEKFYPREEKKYDVVFLGAVQNCYPLRQKIYEGIYFVARGHKILCRELSPNIEKRDNFDKECIVGDKYAEVLGSSRIFIFDCSVYRYPLLKFFEGSASGCLLMSDSPVMGKRLGFVNRITFSEINMINWEEGLKFFLEHPREINKIAKPCMRMTRKYHNHEVRAAQFVQILREEMEK